MRIEDQVVSLELSQKLLTLGVKQNSLFKWIRDNEKWILIQPVYMDGYEISIVGDESCSAYTASELGEMLPKLINLDVGASSSYQHAYLEIIKADKWLIAYVIDTNLPPKACIVAYNLANGLGEMLIFLIENKLISIDQ